jgi:hypothetical protein
MQLAGACSNPEVGVELRRMTKVAIAIKGETARREPRTDPIASSPLRPGWVTDLIVRVLASADAALSPHDVHVRAELVHGQSVSRSSIRNALRIASSEDNAAIERVGYGRYRMRPTP